MSMFCFQCQEAANCTGCTVRGVCGKTEDVAKEQDLLIYILKGISIYTTKQREMGIVNAAVDKFIMESLFATITNANFDKEALVVRTKRALEIREEVKNEYEKMASTVQAGTGTAAQTLLGVPGTAPGLAGTGTSGTAPVGTDVAGTSAGTAPAGTARAAQTAPSVPVSAVLDATPAAPAAQAGTSAPAPSAIDNDPLEGGIKLENVGVLATENEDVRSLRELLTYGVKGIAAYLQHANNLGYNDEKIHGFMQKALVATFDNSLTADELVALNLECGKFGVEAMAILDKANTESYGNPEITKVNIGVRNNPGILISGHDLKDMEELLKQTEGTGVDVYTHGEMLPANYYPEFKKYKHFVGNYGNAWWKQNEEFQSFNGPILMTTNCIVTPKGSYKERIYTTGVTGFPGVKHIPEGVIGAAKDFSQIIKQAKSCSAPVEIEKGEIVGGFAHKQVFALADKIVDVVKTGAIKRFFVMAGCDGRMKSRNYYTEFAEKLPKDTVILTAGCAKYRYNKLQLGDIGGIPRVLDAGQCNDSYSLAIIALKLKEIFELENINELPISYNIAWYEQKAVIVLLALLYLGVKDIHLGPTLPAFLSPNVVKVLVENFGIAGITNADDDIEMFMN